jgi:hypothetical protein
MREICSTQGVIRDSYNILIWKLEGSRRLGEIDVYERILK